MEDYIYVGKIVNTHVTNYNLGTHQILWSIDNQNWNDVYTSDFVYSAFDNLTYYVQVVNKKKEIYEIQLLTYGFKNIINLLIIYMKREKKRKRKKKKNMKKK